MRTVCANGELELEEELVGGDVAGVVRPPVLPADLTELARPVGHDKGTAAVEERCILCTIGAVVAGADEPAARHLIVAGGVVAHRPLEADRLIALTPDHLGASDERVINRSLQWTPPEGAVEPEQPGREPAQIGPVHDARCVVTA